jgi:hypothetical protein
MWRTYRQIMLFAGICFIVSEVVVGAAHMTTRDVMAAYERFLPGQPLYTESGTPCTPQSEVISGEITVCQFKTNDGIFSHVMIVASDNVITRTDFAVIPYRFTLGDSILCWGTPMYATLTNPATETSLNLYWDNQLWALVSPQANAPRPDYFLPITYLSVQRQWKIVERDKLRCATV